VIHDRIDAPDNEVLDVGELSGRQILLALLNELRVNHATEFWAIGLCYIGGAILILWATLVWWLS
jgi:hypothetical protein